MKDLRTSIELIGRINIVEAFSLLHCVKGCKDSIDMDSTDVHLHLNFTLEHLPQSVL